MSEKFNSVWDALFDDPAEKAVLEIKSGLMDEIRQYLKHECLTQEKAAEILGISQPRISDISTGKISKFTIDALVGILAKAGIDIEMCPKNQNNLKLFTLRTENTLAGIAATVPVYQQINPSTAD